MMSVMAFAASIGLGGATENPNYFLLAPGEVEGWKVSLNAALACIVAFAPPYELSKSPFK